VTNNGSPVAVDSFVLSYVAYGPTIQSNTTGFFSQLPDSGYVVTAYIGSLCNDTPRAFVTIPYFYDGCFTLMKDVSCHTAWEYSTNSILPETFTLVSSGGAVTPSLPGLYQNANFYNLPSSTHYTLVSDSGCSEPLLTPSDVSPAFDVIAYLPCVGQPVIQFQGSAFRYCNSYAPAGSDIGIRVSYGDSLIYESNGGYSTNLTSINISQPGYYHYTIFTANFSDTSSLLGYDTICPIDTGTVFLNNVQIPYLLSDVGLVCDTGSHIDTVFYQVYGGAAPYTVEVPGYDTITLQTNTGIFPTRHAGAYTMIVYDDCGISRSVTFNIVDTCNNCPYAAISLPDTIYCAGDTVRLSGVSIHAVAYQWFVDDTLYSTARDTTFLSGAGGNSIMLIAKSITGCADTAYAHTSDTCRGCPAPAISLPDTLYCVGDTVHLTNGSIGGVLFHWLINGLPYSTAADTIYIPPVNGTDSIILRVTSATACTEIADARIYVISPYTITLPHDTTYCGPFSEILNTGIPSTIWSTGVTDSEITVTTPGTYTAAVTNRCGTTTASIILSENPIPVVNLGDDTSICTGTTKLLNAGNPGATYLWQDSSTAQTYTVSTAGTYAVTVTDLSCVGSGSIAITYLSPPSPFTLGDDTSYCGPFGRTLNTNASPPNTTLWSTGSTDALITIDTGGTYTAVVSNKCGSATSSITIIQKPVPTVYLGNDTVLCEGQTLTLNARNPGDTYLWDDGATSATITASAPGTYAVSVTENGCTGTDSIKVSYISAPIAFSVGGDTTFCSGGRLLLEAYQPNVYSVWNTGSTSSYIYVEQSGEYIVLDSNKCGMATDSINITVENCSCKAVIPTAFSPNGDGINDTYGAYAPCIPINFLLEIFDRWGQKLFSSTAITDRWDGTYKNKGQPLGVYAYTMRYTDPYTDLSYFQSGNVTLLR
jgi:gliding motility-associated-like protein